MKKLFYILLGVAVPVLSLCGESVQQLEERLKKSSPGLPEFRAYTDMFGIVRSVRTLPNSKKGGVFKVRTLSAYPRIGMLEITGVSEIDLDGIENFKELKALRLGAAKIRNLGKVPLPGVIRLDISETDITDLGWIKKFPALRILRLPASVKNISSLRGKQFRALSVPGIPNSDAVFRSLGITVTIRASQNYRRRNKDMLPPVTTVRKEGKITALTLQRFTPPAGALSGFVGEMFPEELKKPPVPPVPEEYPGLEKFSRKMPLEASVFLKESKTLQKLDLRAARGVVFKGEEFPELRELYLSGAIGGLDTLKAPKLKKLHLENIEGWIPGVPLESRRRRHLSPLPARPEAQRVKLGKYLNPQTVRITLRRSEFDFSSLKKRSLRVLNCRCEETSLDFLKGTRITHLTLQAPRVTGKSARVLGTLPLRELKIALGPGVDYAFLQQLKLRKLSLNGGADGVFSLALIAKMPLTTLHLRNSFKKSSDLRTLGSLPLRELILDRITFTHADFLGKLTQLKNLALENCVFAPADLDLKEPDLDYVCGDRIAKELLKLTALENLRMGRVGVFAASGRIINYDFPWERLHRLNLKNFSLYAARGDMTGNFKHLKRLKIDDISRHGIAPAQVRTARELETLVLTNIRPRPDAPVPERRPMFRRPVMPAPGSEPGVASKVYIGGPGGFDGGFLL